MFSAEEDADLHLNYLNNFNTSMKLSSDHFINLYAFLNLLT